MLSDGEIWPNHAKIMQLEFHYGKNMGEELIFPRYAENTVHFWIGSFIFCAIFGRSSLFNFHFLRIYCSVGGLLKNYDFGGRTRGVVFGRHEGYVI